MILIGKRELKAFEIPKIADYLEEIPPYDVSVEFIDAEIEGYEILAFQPKLPTSDVGANAISGDRLNRGFQQDAARYVHDGKSNISKNMLDAALKDRADAYPWIMKSGVLALAGIRPGDVLIFETGIEAHDGDIVRAQVENDGGGADTVVRLFRPPNLVGAGIDPTLTPIETVDGERVRIAGVMTELIRFRS